MSDVAREYWFELLIGALGVAAIIELDPLAGRAELELWFAVPAVAVLCCRSSPAGGFPSALRPRTGSSRRRCPLSTAS